MEEQAGIGRGAAAGCLGIPAEERQLADGVEARQLRGARQRTQSVDERIAWCERAAQRDHLVRIAGVAHRTHVAQVDAGLDAFVADPIGVVTFDAVVRKRDLGEGDESAGAAAFRRGGAARPDEVHHRRGIGIVAGLPRSPVAGRVVGRRTGLVKRKRLRAGGLIAAAGNNPGGREVGQVGAPDARPHGIADRAGGGGWLGDVGARGGASVRAGFLLEVREGEAHRDDRVQLGARRELLVHDGARLDRDEGGNRDQQHEDSRHHRQGQDEAETGATFAVFHAEPPLRWYEYYYSSMASGKCHLSPQERSNAGKLTCLP